MDMGTALDRLTRAADGFHIDVMDGHMVPNLLVGPDFVQAVRSRTTGTIDIHLMVAEAERWLKPFADAGADVLIVHPESCSNLSSTLELVQDLGVSPGIAVNLNYPVDRVCEFLEAVDRIVIMATALGIKGADLDPIVYDRIKYVVQLRDSNGWRSEVYVDGGIRRETVPLIARAGADGVIPGSLIFKNPDWVEAVRWIQTESGA
jgi:ribulose-phosphate 3-epimerase